MTITSNVEIPGTFKADAPVKASGPTEAAGLAATQLKAYFGNNAVVKADGTQVMITSLYDGIGEAAWKNATVILSLASPPPEIVKTGISVKGPEGDWLTLNYSAPAAAALLSRNTQVAGKKAQTEAIEKGASFYSLQLAELAGIDAVTGVFGEDTAGRPKKVNAAILDFDYGTNGPMPQYVSGGC
jgi:hypothetical protein